MNMIYNLEEPIKVKAFGNVTQERGHWHNGVKPSNHIVLYCTDGVMRMQVGNDVFRLTEGDVLLIPRNMFYKPLACEKCRYYFLHFSAVEAERDKPLSNEVIISPHTGLAEGYGYTCISNYCSAVDVNSYMKNVPYRIRSIFERAETLHPHTSFFDQLLLDTLARELLVYMGKTETPLRSPHMIRILSYIEQHYAEKITLSRLSDIFSLSESYIARLFRAEVALKPSEYVNKTRISAAKTMLAQTNMSVNEIAEAVGFSDVYYFSKIFKNLVGYPPSHMRK